jgi:hypothetical protein
MMDIKQICVEEGNKNHLNLNDKIVSDMILIYFLIEVMNIIIL